MKIGEIYQQGDVIIRKIKALPKGAEKSKSKVLQFGEVTGHKHQFEAKAPVTLYLVPTNNLPGMRITEENGQKFIQVDAPSLLRHEEHNPIEIAPGCYEIDIVREYDYEADEMTRVVD